LDLDTLGSFAAPYVNKMWL